MTTHDPAEAETVVRDRGAGTTPRRLRVRVLAGVDAGSTLTVEGSTILIGRAADAQLRLRDPMASAFHLEISAAGSYVRVRDLESSNGTFYHGARIDHGRVPSGAVLEIGETRIEVSVEDSEQKAVAAITSFGELRAASAVMRQAFALLQRLARTELSVLLEGPTGTGKELAARALHSASPRAAGPFVVLDCTTIAPSLAESILFGHEKASFTGATSARVGIFEAAHGGTVFLDELGELAPDLQPKLLRVVERREVMRVGATQPRKVDVRIIAATWRDLRKMVNAGTFREDLYHRLAQARVVLPSLQERREDVTLLVHHFLQCLPQELDVARTIARDALEELSRRDYSGNVRELKSVVERAAMLAEGSVITRADLAFERVVVGERRLAEDGATDEVSAAAGDDNDEDGDDVSTFRDAKADMLGQFEVDYLKRLLARTHGNLTQAALRSGMERHHLRRLLRRHGLWPRA